MKKHKYALFAGVLAVQMGVSAMTVEEYLANVQNKNKNFQAYGLSGEAAEDRREAGDIALSPVLTMAGGYLDDKKQPNALNGTRMVARQYSLGVAKEFSTGTQTSLTGTVQQTEAKDIPNIYPAYMSNYAVSSLALSVSQSLWKNAFGSGTRLRQARQTAAATLEKESFNLRQRQILIEAESAYWDYLYQQEELKARQESLDRAKRIENWFKRRFQDGINDKADYFNAQALTASRELLLASAQDQSIAAEKNLRLALEMDDKEKLPTLTSDFKKSRDIRTLISGSTGRVVRLDAYMSSLEAKTRGLAAKEVENSLRPDLVLEGAYNTNSNVQTSTTDALNKINKTDIPTMQVGVKFVYMFDTDAKVSQEALARKEALAARLQSERSMLESENSWAELQRRYAEVLKQITTSERINQLQSSRAKEQSLKLSRGRAVTSDVITSEEDAANSMLTLNRLRSEARKMEAQSRMFIRLNE